PLQQATEKVLKAEAHVFESTRPGTHWLRVSRGGYGRGDLFFAGENPPDGGIINYYLKDKPKGPVTLEIMDVTGRKTTYTIKEPAAGINRILWDMQFDPSEEQMKQRLSQMQNMMDRILQRPEVEETQKKTVTEALERIKKPGLGYREAIAIQQEAFEAIGFGGRGGFGRFGRGGGEDITAQSGTYAVKLTINGKVYDGSITVRADPMLEK
ncbi:MAG: hypothetical protein MUP70_06560, partial [Candidatus Aminicenantes bacterium]|nr:hypothetical protein [Candidatus Aminicenantes bacterium]